MQPRRRSYLLGSYVLGASAARIGDEMSKPALLLIGLAVTGSPSSASALLSGLTISAALGGPVFGVLLDRAARPGRMLAIALGLYTGALAVIFGLLDATPVTLVVLVAVAAGLLAPALSGGWTAQLPRVVASAGDRHRTGDAGLRRATALDAMTFDVGGLLGPVLAGAVAAVAGAPAAMVVAIALIVAAIPSAWALPARPAGDRPPAASVATDLAAGFRALGRSVRLLRATVASVLSLMGHGTLVVAVPLLGRDLLGGSSRGPLLLGLMAATALTANAWLARRRAVLAPDTLIWISCLVLAGALALAATRQPAALIAAVAIAGVADGPQLTALLAVRHREAPARLRAQIFTTGGSLKITGFAVGVGLAGPLASWSVPGCLLVGAALALLAALSFPACSLLPSPRHRSPECPR